jgi:mycothiol S-conjugate amidase
MPDSEANKNPASFAQAPLDEAVGRLVEIIRRERPQVVVTYGENQQGYPHPDHLRVHDITIRAWDDAADPTKYPDAGEPWEIQKLYYTMWSRKRIVAMHEKFLELGLESPYDDRWLNRPSQDDEITTSIDVSDAGNVRADALLAHETQVDPTSKFWFGLPPEVARTVHPFDDYTLGRSRVPSELPEDDLFAGITSAVGR